MFGFGQCPRCGLFSVEHLRTHSYCWECNYAPEFEIRSRVRRHLEGDAYSGRDFQDNEVDRSEGREEEPEDSL